MKVFLLIVCLVFVSRTQMKAQAENHFVTTWKTDNAGFTGPTSIAVPTTGIGYNYDVDWDNDGTFDELGLTGDVSHDFGASGTYTIRIRGDFPQIYFNDQGDKGKLLSVDQWGIGQWTSMSRAFHGCSSLTTVGSDVPHLSTVTEMTAMFSECALFNDDLSTWDVNSVTDMSSVFGLCSSFNGNLESWDVSNVTDMTYMFAGCDSFSGSLAAWDVSNVTAMWYMFSGCDLFNGNIGNWDVSNVNFMNYMFANCTTFNSNLNTWDVFNVTDMTGMFLNCDSFNNWLISWNTFNVSSFREMFQGADAFDQNLGTWYLGNVTDITNMFKFTSLSTENYDDILNSWSGQPLQSGLDFHGGNSMYCTSESARQSIIDTFGWTIADAGLDPICDCPSDISGDGVIDINDFIQFNSVFGETCSGCAEDINEDGIVDINDFLEFNSAFGTTCP